MRITTSSNPLVTKDRGDVSPERFLAFTAIAKNPKISGDFRPSEQTFPETNRWVPLNNNCAIFSGRKICLLLHARVLFINEPLI